MLLSNIPLIVSVVYPQDVIALLLKNGVNPQVLPSVDDAHMMGIVAGGCAFVLLFGLAIMIVRPWRKKDAKREEENLNDGAPIIDEVSQNAAADELNEQDNFALDEFPTAKSRTKSGRKGAKSASARHLHADEATLNLDDTPISFDDDIGGLRTHGVVDKDNVPNLDLKGSLDPNLEIAPDEREPTFDEQLVAINEENEPKFDAHDSKAAPESVKEAPKDKKDSSADAVQAALNSKMSRLSDLALSIADEKTAPKDDKAASKANEGSSNAQGGSWSSLFAKLQAAQAQSAQEQAAKASQNAWENVAKSGGRGPLAKKVWEKAAANTDGKVIGDDSSDDINDALAKRMEALDDDEDTKSILKHAPKQDIDDQSKAKAGLEQAKENKESAHEGTAQTIAKSSAGARAAAARAMAAAALAEAQEKEAQKEAQSSEDDQKSNEKEDLSSIQLAGTKVGEVLDVMEKPGSEDDELKRLKEAFVPEPSKKSEDSSSSFADILNSAQERQSKLEHDHLDNVNDNTASALGKQAEALDDQPSLNERDPNDQGLYNRKGRRTVSEALAQLEENGVEDLVNVGSQGEEPMSAPQGPLGSNTTIVEAQVVPVDDDDDIILESDETDDLRRALQASSMNRKDEFSAPSLDLESNEKAQKESLEPVSDDKTDASDKKSFAKSDEYGMRQEPIGFAKSTEPDEKYAKKKEEKSKLNPVGFIDKSSYVNNSSFEATFHDDDIKKALNWQKDKGADNNDIPLGSDGIAVSQAQHDPLAQNHIDQGELSAISVLPSQDEDKVQVKEPAKVLKTDADELFDELDSEVNELVAPENLEDLSAELKRKDEEHDILTKSDHAAEALDKVSILEGDIDDEVTRFYEYNSSRTDASQEQATNLQQKIRRGGPVEEFNYFEVEKGKPVAGEFQLQDKVNEALAKLKEISIRKAQEKDAAKDSESKESVKAAAKEASSNDAPSAAKDEKGAAPKAKLSIAQEVARAKAQAQAASKDDKSTSSESKAAQASVKDSHGDPLAALAAQHAKSAGSDKAQATAKRVAMAKLMASHSDLSQSLAQGMEANKHPQAKQAAGAKTAPQSRSAQAFNEAKARLNAISKAPQESASTTVNAADAVKAATQDAISAAVQSMAQAANMAIRAAKGDSAAQSMLSKVNQGTSAELKKDAKPTVAAQAASAAANVSAKAEQASALKAKVESKSEAVEAAPKRAHSLKNKRRLYKANVSEEAPKAADAPKAEDKSQVESAPNTERKAGSLKRSLASRSTASNGKQHGACSHLYRLYAHTKAF